MVTIDYHKTVREIWNEWAIIDHSAPSEYYDIEESMTGYLTRDAIALKGISNTKGNKIRLSQCHFGLSALSLALLSADVTGMDFWDTAKTLAYPSGLNCTFTHSNIYKLRERGVGQFDLGLISYGVFCWPDDFYTWSLILSDHLKPGGTLFIARAHCCQHVRRRQKRFWPFHAQSLLPCPNSHGFRGRRLLYGPDSKGQLPYGYALAHSISNIIGSLLASGLILTGFKDYHHCAWPEYRSMTKEGRNHWIEDEKATCYR